MCCEGDLIVLCKIEFSVVFCLVTTVHLRLLQTEHLTNGGQWKERLGKEGLLVERMDKNGDDFIMSCVLVEVSVHNGDKTSC
jgi:hypothetical protein